MLSAGRRVGAVGEERVMPSKVFRIDYAPECEPPTREELRRYLYQHRKDSEWGVAEVEVYAGKLMDVRVAAYHETQTVAIDAAGGG